MLEAEVKLELDARSAEALERRLAELGAKPRPAIRQVDLYLGHPARDFAASDEALRLREDPEGLKITYKGPKLDPPRKTREEIEFALLTDREMAARLLARLGFRPVASVEKERREFVLEDPRPAIVSIDDVRGLGRFCEVEVQEETVATGRARLDRLLVRLDLTHLAPVPQSYLELLLARAA